MNGSITLGRLIKGLIEHGYLMTDGKGAILVSSVKLHVEIEKPEHEQEVVDEYWFQKI